VCGERNWCLTNHGAIRLGGKDTGRLHWDLRHEEPIRNIKSEKDIFEKILGLKEVPPDLRNC